MTEPAVHVDQRGCVVTIGVFDGVHRGHRTLLALARSRADAEGLPLVAITFDPHPLAVVGPRQAPPSLASVELRAELLREAGADAVDILHFTPEVAAMTPEEFVHRVLVERLHVREIVIGADFRFGHRAAGSFETLAAEGERHGFRAVAAPLAGDGEHRWSSTRVRQLIVEGDVAGAAEVLGRPYCLEGEVVHGDHRGRELGYPTANLSWAGEPAVPADGVYAGWLVVAGDPMPAAISVGTNPQFDGRERRVEAYAIDRRGLDLYGQYVRLQFVDRIRGQARFADVDELVARMAVDVEQARVVLGAAPGW